MLRLIRFSPSRVSSEIGINAKFYTPSSKKFDEETQKGKSLDQSYQRNSLFEHPIHKELSFIKWNEEKAVRRTKRSDKFWRKVDNFTDFLKGIQDFKNFPVNLEQWHYYFKNKSYRRMELEQKFLPDRHAILRSDLAAAHFIVNRGGSVKFDSQLEWVGAKHKRMQLPAVYIPGFCLEAIDAEDTNLYIGGLKNLVDLHFLKWLSLKGLKEIDDWCLEYVANEFYSTLEYLDLTDCVNVTYRALSCFYKFENLKTLNLQGVPDTVDLKLACITLQEHNPDLKISGIDLRVPEKIDPVSISEMPQIS